MGAEGEKLATASTVAAASAKKKRGRADSWMPTAVVISNGTSSTMSPGAVELGLILSILILFVYLFGFYESVMSLPEVPLYPDFEHHRGENLNLAHDEWSNQAVTANSDAVSGGSKKVSQPVPALPKTNSAVIGGGGQVVIPAAKWPVSIRNDEDPSTYDTIIHPGDGETKMKVPRFWSPPFHQNRLLTREEVMKVGSCIEPDENGNYARGDSCPLHQRTIYVGIASYRDFECRSTAESIFLRAKYPERIRIGVVDQIVDGEDEVCNDPIEPCDLKPQQGLCRFKDQIDVYQMEAELSIGPVFARHIGYRLYRGEYYATQSDAHVTYTQDWDVDIISQMEITGNEMAVLSTYLTDVQGSIDENGHSLRKTRPIMCNTYYEGGGQGMHLRHGSQPERVPTIRGSPQLQPWWAAGYSFSRGHFVVNVPYDWLSPMIFQGEEMSIGIRGFTIGYDFYAPERSVCFHHYAVGENAKKRNKVHHFWENDRKYSGTGRRAMQRLLGIVHMNPEVDPTSWPHDDEDIYGIGGVRSCEKFYETFGIHVAEKKVENHLCRFVDVGGPDGMHKMFTQYLRSDGMGIDYSQIHYKFKDPEPQNAPAKRRGEA